MNARNRPSSSAEVEQTKPVWLERLGELIDRVEVVLSAGGCGDLFTDRPVTGRDALDLVWGLGTLHCLTQQQPSPSPSLSARGGSDSVTGGRLHRNAQTRPFGV